MGAGAARLCVYTTAAYQAARVTLCTGEEVLYRKTCSLRRWRSLRTRWRSGSSPHEITLSVYDSAGRRLLSYTPAKPKIEKIPAPAEALPEPGKLASCEELYLRRRIWSNTAMRRSGRRTITGKR